MKPLFNVQAFLGSSGLSRRIQAYQRSEVIYSQGDSCDSVLYLQRVGSSCP